MNKQHTGKAPATPNDELKVATDAIRVLRWFLAKRPPHDLRDEVLEALTEITKEFAVRAAPAPIEGFDEFWKLYPKRNGRLIGKKQSQEMWRKLTPEDRLSALVGARNYQQWCLELDRPPRDPMRFLRDRIFDDVAETLEPTAPSRPRWVPANAEPDGHGGWLY